MKSYFLLIALLFSGTLLSQGLSQRITTAFSKFEKDPQLKFATISLYVIEAGSGKVVFSHNALTGMAPASTQKIITTVTALDLLGADYQFKTELGYTGSIQNGVLQGDIHLKGYGDPTLGSWRWAATKEDSVIDTWISALRAAGIKSIQGNIIGDDRSWETATIPGGWSWDDMGNYYGAGASAINWRENQYDMILQAGQKIGDPVKLMGTRPSLPGPPQFVNELRTGSAGSGDNAYIYLPPYAATGYIRGTIPASDKQFTISGSAPNPALFAINAFATELKKQSSNKIGFTGLINDVPFSNTEKSTVPVTIDSRLSPTLDKIIYWFNKKSINLYGEALVKAIAYEKKVFGSTEDGLDILTEYWQSRGIDKDELHMYDGSGLSPLNRVTTHAQVEILKYAKSRIWFPAFYEALPEYNGMKMKSGTISRVKGFCGYHRSSEGKEYIFSMLVNNYNGSASALVTKMYGVLGVLK